MPQRNNPPSPPNQHDGAANVVPIASARRRVQSVPDLSDDEILQLRALASLAPRLLEVLKDSAMLRHRCPTYRRLLDERTDG